MYYPELSASAYCLGEFLQGPRGEIIVSRELLRFFVRRRNASQEPKDKDAVVAIEQALSELTKGLEGIQLLRVLERVSYENEVDVEHFDRWTRIR